MKLIFTTMMLFFTSMVLAEEPNSRTVTETFQDWQLTCVEKGEEKQCRINQTLANKDGQPVAVINLIKSDKGEPVLEVVLPLMLDLTKQLGVTVNDQKTVTYPFRFCNNAACFVIVENDKNILSAFRKGTTGVLTINPIGQAPVNFNFSLKGFTAALSALKL